MKNSFSTGYVASPGELHKCIKRFRGHSYKQSVLPSELSLQEDFAFPGDLLC